VLRETGGDASRRLKILFVCFPYSVHAARWTRLLDGAGYDIHVFPSQPNHHLHEEFRDITFWPVPGLPLDVDNRPIRIGKLPEMPQSAPEARLAALMGEGQFDIVHSLEFQHAGYLTLKALAGLPDRRLVWIATNYGSDISLLGAVPEHATRIREIVSECDYYSAECHRDVGLAREFGLRKPVFTVCPNSGGIDIALATRLRTVGPTSARRVIALKGYQHFAGRALTALQVIDRAREHLRDYRVCIFSPFPEVRDEAERLRSQRGINVECLPEQVAHEDILRLHGSARVSIAISVGDGISTALLEAMAMGSFPIQTCTACAHEWIVDGKSGFIVRPDDLDQIEDRLLKALNDDELVDNAANLNFDRISASARREVVAAQVKAAYAQIPLPNPERPLRTDGCPGRIVLTVITPTYNRADYLKETIDSVLSQGFADLQYVVMDDGSTDETKALIQTYGDRIEYHWHENVGEQRTVNRALGLIRGEFFIIVNSDDPILPDCLTRMVGALRGNAAAIAAYPNWQVIDPKSNPVTVVEVEDFNFARMLASTSVSIGPGACFRRSVLDLVGYRNPLLRYSADLDYWFRIALAGEIIHVGETLATHRTHPGSAIVAERGDLMLREVAYLFEAYSRHPRAPRRIAVAADARGHFSAAFGCTDLRDATRELLRSLLANPITFFACLEQLGLDEPIKLLEQLGGEAKANVTLIFGTLAAAPCRISAYRIVARVALRDPVACLQAAREVGLPHLVIVVRQLPRAQQRIREVGAWRARSPAGARRLEGMAFLPSKPRYSRLFLNLNAIFRHPLKRDKRREYRRNRVAATNRAELGQLDSRTDLPGGGLLPTAVLDHASIQVAQEQPAQTTPAETTLDAAFAAMYAEDPYRAAPLFDEAIGSDLAAASSYALHQYGVALAWVGRLDDAERALRLAYEQEASALVAYRFGSVLAEQRKYSEASAVFAAIDRPESWMAGGSMRSICFPARKNDLHFLDLLFRRTVSGLFDGSAGDRDFVYFVAADSRYVKRFARALHSSLRAVRGNCLLHIHVINPDAATSRLLAYMKERPGPMVAFSTEEVDLSSLSNAQRRVYYASARFFVLSALRRHYDKPVIAADIDQIVLRDPVHLIDPSSDVAAIRFSYGRFNVMARFSASVIIASTLAAVSYFDRVAGYIAERMRDPRAIAWHLDQIALDVAYLVSDDIVLSELPPGAMLSAEPDAEVPSDTYFWSVTYSIEANIRKLAHPIFQKLETVSLIVVTPVFDHSNGLARTIASVARDGYSNVAHVMIDNRRVDGDHDLKKAESAGFAFGETTQDGNGFADLIREMPNAIFVELPCGEELAEQTLLEIMLAVESAGYRPRARGNGGAEVFDLPAGVGVGSKGERLRVFWRSEWTADHSRAKVLVRP
jgi:GT2 family glycosyltransferase/glycosyltransferase involved in cell wall biosynthesis